MQRRVWSSHKCWLNTGSPYRSISYAGHSSVIQRGFSTGIPRLQINSPLTNDDQYVDRVSGIWYIPSPAKTDYKSVIEKLPQLLPQKQSSLTVAVFLATPGTAQWFQQDHEFLTRAMNRIYGPAIPSHPPTSIVGIVDALPSPNIVQRAGFSPVDFAGAEGIAVCLLPQIDTLSAESAHSNESELPVIRFRSHTRTNIDATAQTTASLSVQVANTLFVNGAKSTLLSQAWQLGKGSFRGIWQASQLPEPLSGLSIPINRQPRSIMAFTNRLEPMSNPRKVVSSMGNVLRELEGDDGQPMKASAELEERVPPFLKAKEAEHGPGAVQVYALLMPPNKAVTSVSSSGTSQPDEDQSAHASDPGEGNFEKYGSIKAAIHRALWEGGRVHKVTGGGGGWGKKAGLLSLDTSTHFGETSEFRISMFPPLEDDNANPSATVADEAIPIGYTVQFLATFVGPEADAYKGFKLQAEDAGQWTAHRWSLNEKSHHVVIGTTSPGQESNVAPAEHPWIDGKVIPITSAFGMLSHNGICLATETKAKYQDSSHDNSDGREASHRFRMDAPHTIMHSHWKTGNSSRSQLAHKPSGTDRNTHKQAQSLGTLLEGAIEKAKRPLFRKIKYQPVEKFQIPRSKQKQLSSQTEFKIFEESTEPVVEFKGIRKFKSLKGSEAQKHEVELQPDRIAHNVKNAGVKSD